MKTAGIQEFSALFARCLVFAAQASLLAAATLGFAPLVAAQERAPAPGSREAIYVLHSVREERVLESKWCTPQRAGSVSLAGETLEERFGLWSVQAEPQTGRIADASARKVGEMRTCAAATLDATVFDFFAEGKLAELPFAGNGKCRLVQADFPERGIASFHCYLDLRGLPSEYQGGLATSNTLISAAVVGGETEPPGYLQTSIATFRLWKAGRAHAPQRPASSD